MSEDVKSVDSPIAAYMKCRGATKKDEQPDEQSDEQSDE